MQPIRILHISDLHIERLTRREDRLLKLIAEAQPELILITGDYLNLSYVRDRRAQADVRHLLAQIAAQHVVYAVLGSPPVDERDVVPPLFDDLAVQLLVNESRIIDLDGGRQLALLGLDCSHHIPTDASNLEKVVSAIPVSGLPMVLLYHGRSYIKSSAAIRVSMMMDMPWPLMGIFYIVPSFIRHRIYDWIGRRRYQWYGKRDYCWIPDENIKSRFLS